MNKLSLNRWPVCSASVFLLAFACPGLAQTSLSLNLDYAEGKYGEPEKSTTWTAPLIIKHQEGALALKLNIPYVRATGLAAAGGDRFSSVKQVQTGLGDVVATASYELPETFWGIVTELGVKAKIAAGDHKKDLITTGKHDYSAFADWSRQLGAATAYVSLGWTHKGDPDGVDYRNPWFGGLGVSYQISPDLSAGVFYDYRQKVTPHGVPVSEVMYSLEKRLSARYKVVAYLVQGFSDASPDIGGGATLVVSY